MFSTGKSIPLTPTLSPNSEAVGGEGEIMQADSRLEGRNHGSSCRPHSRLSPKNRVSSASMPGSQRCVVWVSPMEM